jgi:predicted nicotinamide N-methyase
MARKLNALGLWLAVLPLARGMVATSRAMPGSAAAQLVANRVGLHELTVDAASPSSFAPALKLYAPACGDALLSCYLEHTEAFGGRTPYYGIIWPAALALSREIGRYTREGECVLELGTGLGLAGITAALTRQPERVLLVDHDPVAVELALASASLNGVRHLCEGATLDWTRLNEWPADSCSLVIGADILYEPEAAPYIAAVAERVLRPGGRFVIADGKHRPFRSKLKERLSAHGFEQVDERPEKIEWEGVPNNVVIGEYQLR